MAKAFLGGTCNGSKWRDAVMPKLKINYFNPVVPEWNDEARKRELDARENSDYCVYVLTPKMTGVYAVAEVADDSNKRPEKTVFCYLPTDEDAAFDAKQTKSMEQVKKLVARNGAHVVDNLDELVKFLNGEN